MSAPAEAMPLAPRAFGRWIWRQVTSMRTALILLFLLALASVPGSVVPQESVDPLAVSQWRERHEALAPLYDRLGLFEVYSSPWFAAIYLLLMVSLVGCIVPRCAAYWRAFRARPPASPRNLARLPEHRSLELDASPADLKERARAALRRYRVVDDGESLAAESGHLREAGNLVFHLSILVVLVGVAMGALLGYRGGVVVIQGQGFANALSQYDDFAPGDFFDPGSMVPLSLTVDDFDVEFIKEGRAIGAAHKFAADLTYRETPEGPEKHRTIRVNHPLEVDGTSVYLLSHGYAPRITVRDGQGRVALSGPVVFLPQDATFTSFGVVKVPDTVTREGKPLQLGFEGELYPTYGFTMETGPFSAFPEAKDPLISMTVWRGDLGMDTGVPQSVFALQKDGLDAVEKADGKPLRVDLPMGGTVQLPDGMGSITFEGISPFVRLQVSTSPGDWIALLGVSLALLGLMLSLFIRPRRVWVRLTGRPGGPTLVEVAGLDRSSGGDLGDELDRVLARISGEAQS